MTEPGSPLVVEREETDDGLTIARQSPPESAASFSASFVALAGHAFDPSGKEGVALLVGELLGSGAGTLPRLAFARELDRLGAHVTARTSPESIEVTVWGPEAVRERVLDLWALSILRPRFDAEDVGRAKRRLLERQLREAAQPDSRADRELYRTIFPPGHPYRESGLGTERTVRRLTAGALRSFHRRMFRRSGSMVIGTTRLSTLELRRAVERRFRALEGEAMTSPPKVAAPRASPPGERRLVMKGHRQVEVRVGGPSLARSSPGYPAAFLANEVLGGRPLLARLFQKVREEHGLAYDCSSELEAMRWGGIWQVHAGTGPERTDKVVRLIERELDRIRDELTTDAELDRIRESAIGQIPLALETTSGAHELAVDVVYHDLPADFYSRWPETLRALRPSTIRDAARTAFDSKFQATVIAGPASE